MKRDKFTRVQLPRRMGLNAENSVLIKSMRELSKNDFVKERDEFSVRTYYHENESKKAPHLVTTSKKNLFEKASELFEDGLWLIVADKIDAKDCEFRGCVWIQATGRTIVEIAHGPGTVRTVTNEGKIDERHDLPGGSRKMTHNPLLNYCIRLCRKTALRSIVFEFSYYKIPIGWKDEQFICWEITDDGTGLCRLFRE